MITTPVASATARIRSGRRPRPIGVISTSVPMPDARPSSTSSIAFAVSSKDWPRSAVESRNRWSCASTTPSRSTGTGPVTATTWDDGIRPPGDPRAAPGAPGAARGSPGGRMPSSHVVAVTGPVPVDRLGVVDAHDHLFLDSTALRGQSFDDTAKAIEEVLEGRASGIGTLVEMTPIGLGRRPDRMRAVAEATGVVIIAASGYHRD